MKLKAITKFSDQGEYWFCIDSLKRANKFGF